MQDCRILTMIDTYVVRKEDRLQGGPKHGRTNFTFEPLNQDFTSKQFVVSFISQNVMLNKK
jgi:hypothetical protein